MKYGARIITASTGAGFFASLGLLATLLVSCSDEAGGLTAAEQVELDTTIEELEELAGFQVILPPYLPVGLRRVPGTQSTSPDEATIWFGSLKAPEGGAIDEVVVDQSYDPMGKETESCAGWDRDDEFLDVDGVRVRSWAGTGNGRNLVHAFSFWAVDRCIRVHMIWEPFDGQLEFTEEMKEEGWKVVRALLDS